MTYARDVAALLTLCALNFVLSIPANCNTDMIHLVIVLSDTGLYGLITICGGLILLVQIPKLRIHGFL